MNLAKSHKKLLVPRAGVDPAWAYTHWVLNPVPLPFGQRGFSVYTTKIIFLKKI